MTFDLWLQDVDTILYREIGLAHDDMEDWLWHDNFVDGATPEQAAREFMLEVM